MNPFTPLFTVQCSVALLLVSLGGCQPESEFGEEFIRQPLPERHRLILNYPLEQQVDLYLKAMHEIHPPDLGLADVVATHGADIVPVLKARLAGVEDWDYRKMKLIDVFLRMHEMGSYAVAADRELMHFLEQQVAGMEDPLWKKLAAEDIMRIKEEAELRPDDAPR